jgi:hypothetical protein
MKRLWIALVGAALIAGFAAAPAGAAKGTTKIQSVQGTYSGTETLTETCTPGGGGPGGSNVTVNLRADALDTRSSTLGRGTLFYDINWNNSGQPQGGFWAFTASNGKALVAGPASLNVGQQSFFTFTVGVGSGKFAGVTGGQLQTLPTFASGPPCDPNANGGTGETIVADLPVSGTFYGQLIY